ncbi:MAG: energy-coupling factor transporter transmembrane component T family protein [Candidatus Bipolaricaulia bacterium]
MRLKWGKYIDRDSFIHRLDPRTKILSTLALMISVFFIENWPAYLALTIAVITSIWLSRIGFRRILRGIYPLMTIITLTFLLQLFFTPGEPLVSVGPIRISEAGFEFGSLLASRLIFLAIFSALLGFTTESVGLADGLERLLRPLARLRLPVRELALAISIAMRFIPEILEEGESIVEAQKSRGMDFRSGRLVERLKKIVPIVVPLMRNSLKRAEDLALAMEVRCYTSRRERTQLYPLRFTVADLIVLGVVVSLSGYAIVN